LALVAVLSTVGLGEVIGILLISLSVRSSTVLEDILPSSTFDQIEELVNLSPLDHDFPQPPIPLHHRVTLIDSDILEQSHELDRTLAN